MHLAAMRNAFCALGANVTSVDLADGPQVQATLTEAHASCPIDFIYERYALDAYAASDFAKQKGLPLVLEVNAPLAEEAQAHRQRSAGVDNLRERNLFAGAQLVLVVSTALRAWAIQRGARPAHVLVRSNAVDADVFVPLSREHRAERCGASPQQFVLGFHGRLRPWHNFELLLQATACLLAEQVPAHLCCIGDADLEQRCRAYLPAQSYTHIAWLPHAEVARHVACFDVLPLTYAPQEGFYFSPLKLLEAMACAVVPVVPAIGDLDRIVEHGVSGMVYRAGDLDELVLCLKRLHSHPLELRALGVQARQRALRSSWRDVAAEVMQRVGTHMQESQQP